MLTDASLREGDKNGRKGRMEEEKKKWQMRRLCNRALPPTMPLTYPNRARSHGLLIPRLAVRGAALFNIARKEAIAETRRTQTLTFAL
jgi:hypothetical protein